MQLFGDAFRDRKVLITGNTGFKGSWLSSWLLELGSEVFGYSDEVPTTPSLFGQNGLESRIDHQFGDIRDLDRLMQRIEAVRPDFVFHLAAQAIVSTSYRDPLETFSANVMGTATILQALRGVDWPCVAIIITSDKCYENVEWPFGYREIDQLGGKDPYSASKGAAEIAFHAFHCSYFPNDGAVRLASARAGNVIGGGDWAKDRIVVDCINAWSAGKEVEIRSPSATRPWQHVLEPLSGYLTLAAALSGNSALHGNSYNLGPAAEQNRTVVELLSDLADAWGMPDGMCGHRIMGNAPFHEAGLLKLNCDKALMDLRWQPTLTYSECVEMTGGWYRQTMREEMDSFSVTTDQIRTYEVKAIERQRIWGTV